MNSKQLVTGALAGALALSTCLFVEHARAATVYTYTGNNFNVFTHNTPPDGAYDNSMSVTGSVTFLNALAGSLSNADVAANIQGFSLFDGRNTITNLNSFFTTFTVSTDALGNITAWNLAANFLTNPFMSLGDQSWIIQTINDGGTVFDLGHISECTAALTFCTTLAADEGIIRGAPGSWSVTDTSVVPLPAALPLFATGLGALGVLGWRRKRKKAAVSAAA